MKPSAERIRDWARRDPAGGLALFVYIVVAAAKSVPALWGRFSSVHIGNGVDPAQFMWCLVWWPYALSNRLNPFISRIIWSPDGINLTWTKCIPFPSIALWPVTAIFGPLAAYNAMMLLCVPLAEWIAFLLCRCLSRSWWSSLLGGYIFGCSSYFVLEEYAGHPGSALAFAIPLSALAVVMAMNDQIGNRSMVAMLVAALTAQFLISIELFATMTMFGAATLFFAWLFSPAKSARRSVELGILISLSYLITAIIVSPYLYWLFEFGWPHGELFSWVERHVNFGPFNVFPAANDQLMLVALAFAWSYWRTPLGKTLVCSTLAVSLLMSAPQVRVAGFTITTPSGLAMMLPLIKKALPYRYMMYSSLFLAIMAAVWFGNNSLGWKSNLVIAAIVIQSIVPPRFAKFVKPDRSPPFFTTKSYREYLKPGERALVFPFGYMGDSMLWQAETNMYFRMVGGSIGLYPTEFDDWPILNAFTTASFLPDVTEQLKAFMQHHEVNVVIVADSDPDASYWNGLVSTFQNKEYRVGRVTIHRVSPSVLQPYAQITATQMRRRAARAAIDSLLLAAGDWTSSGRNLEELTPFEALKEGFLMPAWCVGPMIGYFSGKNEKSAYPRSHSFCRSGLGGTSGGLVSIGVYGRYADLEPAINRYRGLAAHIFFPYPNDLLSRGAAPPPPNQWALLEMEFSKDDAAALTAKVRSQPGS